MNNTPQNLSPAKGDYLPDKVVQEFKEALYQEIGVYAEDYTDAELRAFGNFVLSVVVIGARVRLRKLREERRKDLT